MSYYMRQVNGHFIMKKEKKVQALNELKDMITKGNTEIQDYFTQDIMTSKSLEEVLLADGWECETDIDGNIIDLWFKEEKINNEYEIFNLLAPYVEEECFIEMIGEDDSRWRWVFNGEICMEKNATIVWED